MAGVSNFPGGFAQGVTIRGVPIAITHPGKAFWVSNSGVLSDNQIGSSNANKGTFDQPFSTITGALAQVVANRGDVVFVKPGHAETVSAAAGIVLNKAGVAIIGLGSGSKRPTITMSAATSTITLAANDMSIQNFLFIGTAATTFVASVFVALTTVVANDFTVDSCEFRDLDATHGIKTVVLQGGTTANAMDGLYFTNNKVFRSLTSPPAANTAVILTAATNRIKFSGNTIVNLTANNNIALGLALGANVALNSEISGNRTTSQNTGTTAGELFSGGGTESRGLVFDNYSAHLAATGLLGPVLTKMGWIENYCHVTGAVDASAKINPVAA